MWDQGPWMPVWQPLALPTLSHLSGVVVLGLPAGSESAVQLCVHQNTFASFALRGPWPQSGVTSLEQHGWGTYIPHHRVIRPPYKSLWLFHRWENWGNNYNMGNLDFELRPFVSTVKVLSFRLNYSDQQIHWLSLEIVMKKRWSSTGCSKPSMSLELVEPNSFRARTRTLWGDTGVGGYHPDPARGRLLPYAPPCQWRECDMLALHQSWPVTHLWLLAIPGTQNIWGPLSLSFPNLELRCWGTRNFLPCPSSEEVRFSFQCWS